MRRDTSRLIVAAYIFFGWFFIAPLIGVNYFSVKRPVQDLRDAPVKGGQAQTPPGGAIETPAIDSNEVFDLRLLKEEIRPQQWEVVLEIRLKLEGKKPVPVELYPREVFLTFDDGPSANITPRILDALAKADVKATFFVIGQQARDQPEILAELVKRRMAVVAHSYTHQYSKVYASTEGFMAELAETNALLTQATGKPALKLTRWPGGSDNQVSSQSVKKGIKQALAEKGIKYVDWNVSSADADREKVSAARIRENVISQMQGKTLGVVLFHDSSSKAATAEALPEIIYYLKQQGYVFRTFDNLTVSEEQEMYRLKIVNK